MLISTSFSNKRKVRKPNWVSLFSLLTLYCPSKLSLLSTIWSFPMKMYRKRWGKMTRILREDVKRMVWRIRTWRKRKEWREVEMKNKGLRYTEDYFSLITLPFICGTSFTYDRTLRKVYCGKFVPIFPFLSPPLSSSYASPVLANWWMWRCFPLSCWLLESIHINLTVFPAFIVIIAQPWQGVRD